MIPKRVVLENFLSFGSKTEIAFTDDEPLWVLGGSNGVGKSAVFDAITFCLFGAHRGGKGQGMDELVRHGENGFHVEFEFEFNGVEYRIRRNHKLRGRPTARVELRRNGECEWAAIAGVNSAADVKGWSERTLGMPVEAFAASVLLRQGQADEIITATGTRRLDVLKKIIAAERYEDLSKRVHEGARAKGNELDRLKAVRENTPAISEEHLEAARGVVQAASNDRTLAETARQTAATCVAQAKRYADLEKKRRELVGIIAAADTRAAADESIRRDNARLDELNAILPTLTALVPLKQLVGELGDSLGRVRISHTESAARQKGLSVRCEGFRLCIAGHRDTAADHATRACSLRTNIGQQSKFLSAAEDVAKLDARDKDYDPNLDRLAADAEQTHTDAVAAERTASDAVTKFDTLVKQATKEQKQFESVEVGVKCLRCGQKVTAEHADVERMRIAAAIAELTRDHAAALEHATNARNARDAAESRRKEYVRLVSERNGIRQRLDDQRRNLESLGGTSDVTRLRELIHQLTGDAEKYEKLRDVERTSQSTAEGELQLAEIELKAVEVDCREQTAELTQIHDHHVAGSARLDALSLQLSASWHETTAVQLVGYVDERGRLKSLGIDEQFRKLMEDAALRGEWDRQLCAAIAESELIPEAARIFVADAESLETESRTAFTVADGRWQTARDALGDLARQASQFAQIKREVEGAEVDARVHARLDGLLGKVGLQRELVRDAETQIVGFAQSILHNLSAGELSVELNVADESGDEAFALWVRRADDPTPIGVDYLSGSQKFRVAISVALAIGRFAAGQARPLECVIIDEGFGSLDKDGLRAAAEELNRLKQYLRRIVLVSHQEEFTEHFPVMIRLSKGESGTTAEKVRR